jgi:hypothetical protein
LPWKGEEQRGLQAAGSKQQAASSKQQAAGSKQQAAGRQRAGSKQPLRHIVFL